MDLLIRRVRAGSPQQQAAILREALNSPGGDTESITKTLLSAIEVGLLPAPAIQPWLAVAKSPVASALALKQKHSAIARRIAMARLAKQLRRSTTFATTWDALGGAQGIARTMYALSVHELRCLCTALGDSARGHVDSDADGQVSVRRRRCITELFDLLMDEHRNGQEKRPVRPIYSRLMPACTLERAMEFADRLDQHEPGSIGISNDTEVNSRLQKRLPTVDWAAFEKRAFGQAFYSEKLPVNVDRLRPFIERNLDFGLQVLGAFVDSEDLRGETPGRVLSRLVVPLARSCSRRPKARKARRGAVESADAHAQLWRLIRVWLEKHYLVQGCPHPDKNDAAEKNLVSCVDRCWNPGTGDSDDETNPWMLLSPVLPKLHSPNMELRLGSKRPGLRYGLLRTILLYSPGHSFDIGDPSETSSAGLKGIKLRLAVFTCLPAVQGLVLFERCLEANSDLSFLCWGREDEGDRNGLLRQALDMQSGSGPDWHILRAVLLQSLGTEHPVLPKDPDSILNQLRTTELAHRMKRSAQGSDPSVRSFWAISALRLCVALDDLDLLRDTFIWTRRYDRDPIVSRELRLVSWRFDDLENMLSCISVNDRLPQGGLRTRMDKANAVAMANLETGALVRREPGFRYHHSFATAARTIADVTASRLRQLHRLQEPLGISDDEAFQGILQPTLDLLIRAEAVLLENKHLSGGGIAPVGLLLWTVAPEYGKKTPGAPILTFFDTLAEQRNDLWEKHRSQNTAAVTTLPVPWPRGLPVQSLVEGAPREAAGCPYLQKRITAVVFCDPEVALQPVPKDGEVLAAIETNVNDWTKPFIDSWVEALRLWLSEVEGDGDERGRRISRAWNHALGPLTGGRMSNAQAQRFWLANGFEPAGAKEDVEVMIGSVVRRHIANMPQDGESGYPIEWDPDPEYPDAVTHSNVSRGLEEATCLDCMLLVNNGGRLRINTVTTPVIPDPPSFWDLVFSGRRGNSVSACGLKGSTIDTAMAAAMLHVSSVLGADGSLLMKPFPGNTSEPRFSAAYLDQDFLQRTQHLGVVLSTLERLTPFIPPQLLSKLAASMMSRLESGDASQPDYSSLAQVIKMLVRSDSPTLAVPLIARFILDGDSDASSWYRVFLNPTVLTLLDSKSAESFFTSLSESIVERLRGQEGRNVPDRPERAPSPVKVTTVKMIAQLLRGGRFIDPKVSLDILMQLARAASHIDIRLEVMKSLEGFASTTEQKVLVMDFLRDLAPRIAGAMNERHPETEADWEAAEKGGPLPEVAPTDESSTRPLLRFFAEHESGRDMDMVELGLQILAVSAGNNSRWTKLFLKKHGFSLDHVELPSIPTRPEMLAGTAEVLLRRDRKRSRLPIQQFESMRQYVLLLLDPPPALEAITKSIEDLPKLCRSNAGRHWLHIWKPHALKAHQCGGRWMCDALGASTSPEERPAGPGFVTRDMVEDAVMDMAEIHLSKGAVDDLLMLVGTLTPDFDLENGATIETRGAGKVLRQLISRIDNLRTAEWQTDRNRKPAKLPDTFKLRLKLLSLPGRWWTLSQPPDPQVPRRHLPGFVDRIVDLLRSVVDSGMPYFEQYSEIEKHLAHHVEQKLYVASMIGSTSRFRDAQRPSLTDLLCVRLAASLVSFRNAPYRQEHDIPAAREMVESWEDSVIEEVRNQASWLRQKLRSIARGKSPLGNWLDGEEATS